MSDKEIRKAAHTFANLHKDDAGSMLSLALNGGEQIYSHSAPITGTPNASNPFPTYLIELASKLPWNGLTKIETQAFSTCAEAHVWLELMSRGKNPRNYTLVSFNSSGIIAAPCRNCSQWVGGAFAAVYQETTAYRRRQNPNN